MRVKTTSSQTEDSKSLSISGKAGIAVAVGATGDEAQVTVSLSAEGPGTNFYVDPINGLDANNGLSWPLAFKTIQKAIDACTHDKGDHVFVAPHTETVTTSVLFNKKGITVQGVEIYGPDRGERFMIDGPTLTTTPVALFSEPAKVIGLGFQGANATGPSVEFGPGSGFDGGNFCQLVECRFTNWHQAQEAILSSYNDYLVFERCDFDGTINGAAGSANVFDSGIRIIQGHYVSVLDCTFRGCTYGLTHGVASPTGATHGNMEFLYKGNKIMDGKFIDFGSLINFPTQVGLVSDNWLGTATDATTYSDTVVNLKAVGVCFSGNHYAE